MPHALCRPYPPAPFPTAVSFLRQYRASLCVNSISISLETQIKSNSCKVDSIGVVSACNLLSCCPQKLRQGDFEPCLAASLTEGPDQYSGKIPRHFGRGSAFSPPGPVSERARACPELLTKKLHRASGKGHRAQGRELTLIRIRLLLTTKTQRHQRNRMRTCFRRVIPQAHS
jgi:hypothetical protein